MPLSLNRGKRTSKLRTAVPTPIILRTLQNCKQKTLADGFLPRRALAGKIKSGDFGCEIRCVHLRGTEEFLIGKRLVAHTDGGERPWNDRSRPMSPQPLQTGRHALVEDYSVVVDAINRIGDELELVWAQGNACHPHHVIGRPPHQIGSEIVAGLEADLADERGRELLPVNC